MLVVLVMRETSRGRDRFELRGVLLDIWGGLNRCELRLRYQLLEMLELCKSGRRGDEPRSDGDVLLISIGELEGDLWFGTA